MIRSFLIVSALMISAPAHASRTPWDEHSDPEYQIIRALACFTSENAENVLEMVRHSGLEYTVEHYLPILEESEFCMRVELQVPLGKYLACKKEGCSFALPGEEMFRFGILFPELPE